MFHITFKSTVIIDKMQTMFIKNYYLAICLLILYLI